MSLKFFNTLTKKKQEFITLTKNKVKIYTCGPTVYNFPHIGNLRSILFADTLYRWLKFGEKYETNWVMNITDVDDKTIRNSKIEYPNLEPKKALKKFTRKYEKAFFEDLEKLNINQNIFQANPRATEYIEAMQEIIKKIYKNGYAKIIDGSVFFDVTKYSKDQKYGVLLNLDLKNLKSGTRTLADEIEKDNPQDFALWKAKKEDDEPSWDFEFNGQNLEGRPGWHIECTAMSCSLLGLPFDIHTGGIDLIFPHHEDEIAQAKAGQNQDTANFWLHNGHLLVDNQKMSKSLGNFFTLRDLIKKGFKSDAIRFFLISNHYRSKVNLIDEAIISAHNSLEKIRNLIDLFQKNKQTFSDKLTNEKTKNFLINKKDEFYTAMRDDLNTPIAIRILYEVISQLSNFSFDPETKKQITEFINLAENIFGVRLKPKKIEIPDEIIKLAEDRLQAKKENNYQEADQLRDSILAKGYELRDVPDGFEILSQEK